MNINPKRRNRMSAKINPLVVDLSHYEWPVDFAKIKAAGYTGVIWKATQGLDYTDPTYKEAKAAAKKIGLLWGSFHFGDNSDTDGQSANYLNFAQPEADELICLDWEDNGSSTMEANQAQNFIESTESGLNRPQESVIYGGNVPKEKIKGKNAFFGARRLWLAQYGATPSWQESWTNYWLWQFTDGTSGPEPHTVNGVSGGCDLNSYANAPEQLAAEWASGTPAPPPPPPPPPPSQLVVTLTIDVPAGVTVNVVQNPVVPS